MGSRRFRLGEWPLVAGLVFSHRALPDGGAAQRRGRRHHRGDAAVDRAGEGFADGCDRAGARRCRRESLKTTAGATTSSRSPDRAMCRTPARSWGVTAVATKNGKPLKADVRIDVMINSAVVQHVRATKHQERHLHRELGLAEPGVGRRPDRSGDPRQRRYLADVSLRGESASAGTRAARANPLRVTRSGASALTLSAEIRQRFDEFSRSQKDVGQYIVDHLEEAAFHTAEELARRANTSSSTVVRFAQALGFEGFPELQASAREEYRRARNGSRPARSSRSANPAALPDRPDRVRGRPRPPTT